MQSTQNCWCGNQELKEFSPEYSLCSQCGTLVLTQGLTLDEVRVNDDEHDLYSKEYWLSYQTQQYGYPDIYQRSRQDIPERCLYWLHTLMTCKLPPANVLELGCAHGASVALMEWAGFDATGLELSPWVVDFAKKTFDISMLLGPLEDQQLEPQSLDAIILYDVMEHLPDPISTMRHAASLLKEEGIFIVQTPNYIEGKTYPEMVSQKDHFLDQLKPMEHTYLFNHRSVAKFFRNIGFDFLQFEQPLFDYDMYFVASRHPIVRNTDEQIAHNLLKRSSGRMILALLDQSSSLTQLQPQYLEAENDRAECLKIIEQQGQEIAELHSKLYTSLNELQQTQTQLTQSQSELQQTQTQLAEEKRQVQQFQQHQLQQLQKQINETERQFKATNADIAAMKTSKFWKMRSLWFKVKTRLGWPTDT
jgi:2-polyprenyl-3-methyl-5-hydroxy-6-metoxy-1,4-benzoquinol methylase